MVILSFCFSTITVYWVISSRNTSIFSASVHSTMTGRGSVLVISISNTFYGFGAWAVFLFHHDTAVVAFDA